MKPYTPTQLTQYLTHISYPTPSPLPPPTLQTLHLITAHQLATLPFESISLHYSPTRRLTLDPDALLAKVIGGYGVGGKRGGYCMEVNTVLACVLKGLGFDVCSLGARISFATDRKEGEGYGGWSHMANVVTIEDTRYLLDVGFGGNTALTPIPLPTTSPTTEVGNRKLTLKPLLSTSHPSSPASYVYSHRASPSDPWTDAYALSREEFHAPDFVIMNLSTMSESIFTRTLVSVRAFFADEAWFAGRDGSDAGEGRERGAIAGQLILVKNMLKYRLLNTPVGTKVADAPEWAEDVPLATFTTEDQRVDALRTYFGVELSAEERAAILDLSTAIGADEGPVDPREAQALEG